MYILISFRNPTSVKLRVALKGIPIRRPLESTLRQFTELNSTPVRNIKVKIKNYLNILFYSIPFFGNFGDDVFNGET